MEPLSNDEIARMEAIAEEDWREQSEAIVDYFTPRELKLALNCVEYRDGDPAGLPGHNLMILVAKLATFYGWDDRDERLANLIERAEEVSK